MNLRNLASLATLTFAFTLSSCSGKKKSVQLFYGACKVEVSAKPDDADILIDGIKVGHEKIGVDIPCGEKKVQVLKEGYAPYENYLTVSKEKALNVSVELQTLQKHENYALSDKLTEQLYKGEALIAPDASEEDIAIAKKVADSRLKWEASNYAKKAAAAGESAAAASSGAASTGQWLSVEDWR